MEFKNNEAIYIQIMDYLSEQILLRRWSIGEKVPSVREMASTLEVNPNTVMRSYEQLQQAEIIYNKRGIGFFVAEHASTKIKEQQQAKFLDHELPEFFKTIYLLNIPMEEIIKKYKAYLTENHPS